MEIEELLINGKIKRMYFVNHKREDNKFRPIKNDWEFGWNIEIEATDGKIYKAFILERPYEIRENLQDTNI